MKRTMIVVAGVVALCSAIYISNKLGAQTAATGAGTAPVAQPKTKVALLNLRYVVENYNKYKLYQDEFKKLVEPYSAKDTALKKQAEDLAKQAQTAPADKRDQIEREMKDLQRKAEDNKNEAQKIVVKKQEEQLKTLYMDVRGVVERYAQAHGYEMVLHYNDAIKPEEYWSAANIARKMQAGACMPMYIANGLDISANVLSTLNASGGSTPAAGAAGSR